MEPLTIPERRRRDNIDLRTENPDLIGLSPLQALKKLEKLKACPPNSSKNEPEKIIKKVELKQFPEARRRNQINFGNQVTPGTSLDPNEALSRLAKFEELKKQAAKEQKESSPIKPNSRLRRKSSFDMSDILTLQKQNNSFLNMEKIVEEEHDTIGHRNSGFSVDRRNQQSKRKQTTLGNMSQFRARNVTMYDK